MKEIIIPWKKSTSGEYIEFPVDGSDGLRFRIDKETVPRRISDIGLMPGIDVVKIRVGICYSDDYIPLWNGYVQWGFYEYMMSELGVSYHESRAIAKIALEPLKRSLDETLGNAIGVFSGEIEYNQI